MRIAIAGGVAGLIVDAALVGWLLLDELEAAGLAVGDQVVSAKHSGVGLKPFERRQCTVARWGEEVTLVVKRGTERHVVRAQAPTFTGIE